MFISKCQHCSGMLLMKGKRSKVKMHSCSKCVPVNSSLRDDINESYSHEIIYLKGSKKGQPTLS